MSEPLPVVRCGSCGQRATTTIILHGFGVPVCLRHLNVWKTPDFDADAAMLAEARAEGAAGVVDRVEEAFAFVAEIVVGFDTEVSVRAAINLIRQHASLADPEATP